MKKKIFIILVIIMFNFNSTANAKYEKLFFDFNIKSNNGDILSFKDYKINPDYKNESKRDEFVEKNHITFLRPYQLEEVKKIQKIAQPDLTQS